MLEHTRFDSAPSYEHHPTRSGPYCLVLSPGCVPDLGRQVAPIGRMSTASGPARATPPRAVDAELVSRRMSAGRTKPVIIHGRDAAGSLLRCVVKPRNHLTMPPTEYLLEWLGASLARALGLLTPESLAVSVSAEFAGAVDSEFRADMMASIGLVYGSGYVDRPYTQLATEYALSSDQRETAARILAFDVFIHNADRRPENHNLFVKRNDLLVYDHEAAFDFLLPIFGRATDPALDPCPAILQRHLFRDMLRGKKISLAHFGQNLERLDDVFFASLKAAAPVDWTVGLASDKLDRVLEVLQKRRDAVNSWLPQVQAWLNR